MPFLSSLGGAIAFGFGFTCPRSGEGAPVDNTMYYYEGPSESDTTSTWFTLEKWYTNSAHTTQASALPTGANPTVILNDTSIDLENQQWVAPASIDITGHTLTITAHQPTYVSEGSETLTCAAAVQFNVSVVMSSGGTAGFLDIDGHIEIPA